MSILQIKLLTSGAIVPVRSYPDDAGLDLHTLEVVSIPPYSFKDVKTGLAVKIADGFWGLIRPRSSTFFKRKLVVHEGTIDPGYIGELNIGVYNPGSDEITLLAGDRIAQLVIVPLVIHEIQLVDSFPPTSRGVSGFGSTGY